MKTVEEKLSAGRAARDSGRRHIVNAPARPAAKLTAQPRFKSTPLASVLVEQLRLGLDSDDHTPDRRILLDKEVNGYRIVLIREKQTPTIEINLSPREQEIVRMIAKGYPNKAIAAVLDISCWTVGTHLRRVFAKLGVTCRAAMVAKLMELRSVKLLA